MTVAGPDADLIAAIHARALPDFAARVARDAAVGAEARDRAMEVLRVCDRIGASMEAERTRLGTLLGAAGIRVIDEGPIGPIQRHEMTLEIGRDDARGAVAVLEDEGYARQGAYPRGAERSFWAFGHEVAFERTDRATVVVRLRWSDPGSAGGLARVVRPARADWAMVDLPERLWWAYSAVRPARLLLERLGWRPDGRAEPEPFLATPGDLISPLLAAADVGERDVLLDVGCGDGRIVVEAARTFGCRAIGVERSAARARDAADRVAREGLSDRVRIVHGDGLDLPTSEVSLAVLFLPMRVAASVVPALLGRLPVGARVWLHEQSALGHGLTPPDRSVVVLGDESVTVAHRWTVGGRP